MDTMKYNKKRYRNTSDSHHENNVDGKQNGRKRERIFSCLTMMSSQNKLPLSGSEEEKNLEEKKKLYIET